MLSRGRFMNFKVHVLNSSSFISIRVYLLYPGMILACNVPEPVPSLPREVKRVINAGE